MDLQGRLDKLLALAEAEPRFVTVPSATLKALATVAQAARETVTPGSPDIVVAVQRMSELRVALDDLEAVLDG